MHRKGMAYLLIAAILATGMVACAYNVTIMTDPEGAKCYVQGMYIGTTPATYRTRSGTPQTVMVKIAKPGFKDVDTVIDSHYKADISLLWLIPGLIPYFVGTAEYEDNYNFVLDKQ